MYVVIGIDIVAELIILVFVGVYYFIGYHTKSIYSIISIYYTALLNQRLEKGIHLILNREKHNVMTNIYIARSK